MTSQERWARIQDLCIEIERSGDYSASSLETTEPSLDLREEALSLALAAREEAAFQPPVSNETRHLPSNIGPYRVTGFLGQGGTSVVYSAEQDRDGVTHTVAIKHLHAHLNQGDTLARFQREYAILGRLRHPQLVHVHDTGSDETGRPYLVMELVAGKPLDRYCDEHRLALDARVRLLLEIAEAIAVAHENLVVHLDLKPSNLLVTAAGNTKVLDFGTAKVLDAGSTMTVQLTPSYASPEQLCGEPVTARCDIYTLGLICYDLLSGGKAFGDRSSLAGVALRAKGDTTLQPMERHVTAASAELRGSTIPRFRRLLRGDLDAVIAKALEHDPARRYESMAAFAADLKRYLAGQPVSPRPLALVYRIARSARRHPRTVAACVAFAVLTVSLAGYGFLQWRRAELAAARMAGNSRFAEMIFTSAVPTAGSVQDLKYADVLVQASNRLRNDSTFTADEKASVQTTLAVALFQMNKPHEAVEAAAQAADWARGSHDPGTLARFASGVSMIRMSAGDCDGARDAIQSGVRAYESRSALTVMERISFLQARAQVRGNCQSDPAGQLADLETTVGLLPQLNANAATYGETLPYRLSNIYGGYAYALVAAKQYGKAREAISKGLQIAEPHTQLRGSQSLLHRLLSAVEYASGNLQESVDEIGKAADLAEGWTSEFEVLRDRMVWAARMADAGDRDRALAVIARNLQRLREHSSLVGKPQWMVLVDAAVAYQRAGNCAPVPGLLAEAERVSEGIGSPVWRGNSLTPAALCLADTGHAEEARAKAREALKLSNWPDGSPIKRALEAAAK